MNDTIFLKGMKFYGYHALTAENEIGQIFSRRNFKSRLNKRVRQIMLKILCIMVKYLKM